jgi:hypothetical protein
LFIRAFGLPSPFRVGGLMFNPFGVEGIGLMGLSIFD